MDGKKVKLRLEHISQSYIVKNEVSDAVVDVSLDVYDNEFLVILGPGRCGKTVLLNMIAGLESRWTGVSSWMERRSMGATSVLAWCFRSWR